MSSAIDHTYQYAHASVVTAPAGRPRLALATSDDAQENPYFFEGSVRRPQVFARMLLTLCDVVRTHFFLPMPALLDPVLTSSEDISLLVDTEWLVRFEQRSEHPSNDAEKVTVENGIVTRIHREIEEADAYGEYIGVAKFSSSGAMRLKEHYHKCRRQYTGRSFREAKVFEKAYKIHLFQHMIEAGERMVHVDTPGGYIEVDTQQDFDFARNYWQSRHLKR